MGIHYVILKYVLLRILCCVIVFCAFCVLPVAAVKYYYYYFLTPVFSSQGRKHAMQRKMSS